MKYNFFTLKKFSKSISMCGIVLIKLEISVFCYILYKKRNFVIIARREQL